MINWLFCFSVTSRDTAGNCAGERQIKEPREHHAKEKADGLPVALYLEAPPIDGPLRHGWPLQQSI